MLSSVEIGQRGEVMAIQYLQSLDFNIMERNWRAGHLEIDIIASKNNVIHIIEVKYRREFSLLTPLESVNVQKQKNLIKAANVYIRKNRIMTETVFDIVSIIEGEKGCDVQLIENAFYPF